MHTKNQQIETPGGFKVAVSQDFCINFFHESNPSGPQINRLKWFCLKICFRGDIRETFDSAQW